MPTTYARTTFSRTGAALIAGALAAAGVAQAAPAYAADPVPLEHAHGHNDYLHARPLFDALDHGFTSVEADVWLSGGKLCLGHYWADCTKTLEANYLAPLAERIASRGGSVYDGWQGTFQLLIDLKTSAATTWPAVEAALSRYPGVFIHWRGLTRVSNAPVRAVISGNRSLAAMEAVPDRWSAYDGELSDLGRGLSPELMPMVSGDWWQTFWWHGEVPIPAGQQAKLQGYADAARAGGYQLRFYATFDLKWNFTATMRRRVWDAELAAGVWWLNSNDLGGLESYLRARA